MLALAAEAAVDASAVTPWWVALIGVLAVGLLAGFVFLVVLGFLISSMTGSEMPWFRRSREEPPQENPKDQENP